MAHGARVRRVGGGLGNRKLEDERLAVRIGGAVGAGALVDAGRFGWDSDASLTDPPQRRWRRHWPASESKGSRSSKAGQTRLQKSPKGQCHQSAEDFHSIFALIMKSLGRPITTPRPRLDACLCYPSVANRLYHLKPSNARYRMSFRHGWLGLSECGFTRGCLFLASGFHNSRSIETRRDDVAHAVSEIKQCCHRRGS